MRTTRIPALDGLRGVAVAGVVAFHTGATWARGGYLGVSLFFTLSGYLIAGLLLREFDEQDGISLGRFWTRRFRRLWPAATITVVAVLVANAVTGQFDVHELAGDALASIANVANWRFLLAGRSYQDLFEAPSPLLHFWSLAIEEQFYIVFPLIIALCLRRGRRVAWGVVGTLYALSVASQFLATSPDVAYLSTHTRASEILIGVMVALWVSAPNRGGRMPTNPWLRVLAPLVGIATLVAWSGVPKSTPAWENGGFVAVGLASCVLIAGSATERGLLPKVLGGPALRWLGTRSFAIYLFHWPIFVMWAPSADGRVHPLEWVPRLVVVGLLAEASYRLVEMPIRRVHLLVRGWWGTVAVTTSVLVALMALVLVLSDPPEDRFELRADPATFVPPTASSSPTGPPTSGGGAAATSSVPGSPQTTVVEPTPTTPPRIAVYGDSTARAAADGLVQWSEDSQEAWVYDLSKPSCPISEYAQFRQSPNEATQPRAEECDWRGRFGTWLGDYSPDLVVVIGGTSEIVDFEAPGINRTNILSPEGYDFIKAELTALATELRASAPDATLVLTTAPYNDWLMCISPCLTHETERFDEYNHLVTELVLRGVFDDVIDYADHINSMELEPTDPIRPDGVHLSEDGSLWDAERWLGPRLLDAV